MYPHERQKRSRSFQGACPWGRFTGMVPWLAAVILVLLLAACDRTDQDVDSGLARTSTGTTVLTSVSAPPPDPVPYGTGRWSVETSLGEWEWNVVNADGFARNVLGPIDGRYYDPKGPESWLQSEDGLTWIEGPVPEFYSGAPFLNDSWFSRTVDGEQWAVVEDFFETEWVIYRNTGASWTESKLHDVFPQAPGLRPIAGPLSAAADQATAVVLIRPYGEVDWEPIYGEPLETRWDEQRGTVELVKDFEVVDELIAVTVGSPPAIEFRRPGNGQLVNRVDLPPGVAHTHVLNGSLWWLLVDGGDGFRAVSPPWGDFSFNDAAIARGEEGFVLVVNNELLQPRREPTPEGPFAWRSLDGFNWEFLGAVGLPNSIWASSLVGEGGRMFINEPGGFGGPIPPGRLWTSQDGVGWQPMLGFGDPIEVAPTSFGWMLPTFHITTSGEEHFEVWVSADGLNWESVPMTTRVGLQPFSFSSEGDLVFLTQGGLVTVGGPAR